MIDPTQIDALAAEAFARSMAKFDADRETARLAQQVERDAAVAAWRAAIVPTATACGVRPFCLDAVVERASSVFELKDGALVPKPGVNHPRDPCAELDPLTWLADLRTGPDGDLLFGK